MGFSREIARHACARRPRTVVTETLSANGAMFKIERMRITDAVGMRFEVNVTAVPSTRRKRAARPALASQVWGYSDGPRAAGPMDQQLSRGPGFCCLPNCMPNCVGPILQAVGPPPENLSIWRVVNPGQSVQASGSGGPVSGASHAISTSSGSLLEIAVQLAGLFSCGGEPSVADVTALAGAYVASNHPHGFLLSFDGTLLRRTASRRLSAVQMQFDPLCLSDQDALATQEQALTELHDR